MQFFLYEILARVVAIYLCVDCVRKLRGGVIEGKIAYINDDVLDFLFLDRSNLVAHRDVAPVRFWLTMSLRSIALAACLYVAVLGWRQPTP